MAENVQPWAASPGHRPPSRAHDSREYPYVLDLHLPSIDWDISSLSTIEEGAQAAAGSDRRPGGQQQQQPGTGTGMSSHIINVFDALYPSRAASFRESLVLESPQQLLSASPPPAAPGHGHDQVLGRSGPSRTQSQRSRNRRSRVVSLHDDPIEFAPLHPVKFSGTGEDEGLETIDYPSGWRLWSIMVALLLSIFLIALDMTIVATAIPSITDEFHGLSDVAWYGSVFFMTIGAFQPMWGKIYRYFSLKYSYLLAIAIFELGSLVCGVAPTSRALIVGRAISGVGAAGIASGSYTIVGFITEPKRRPMFTGIIGAMFGTSTVLGPLLGGVLTGEVSWRWCFYINLPIGGVTIIAIVFLFSTPAAAKPQPASLREKILQMDPVGVALVLGALVCYILAVQDGGQTRAWDSSVVIGLLVGAAVIAAAFAAWEYLQAERAMVIPRLFVRPEIMLSSLYTFFLSGAFYTVIYYLPVYFQGIRGTSEVESGVDNLPCILAGTLGALCAGAFISSTGMSTVIMFLGAAVGTLGCGLCYLFDVDTPTGTWIGFQIVAGLGLGGSFQIPIIVGQVSVDAVDLSSVTALLLLFQNVGGALLVSAAQSAFVNRCLVELPGAAPGVNPAAVVSTGATQLRQVFPADVLPGILTAYLSGIRLCFALACVSSGIAMLVSLHLPWKRLNTEAIKAAGGAA